MGTKRSGDRPPGNDPRRSAPVSLRSATARDVPVLVAHRRAMFFAMGGFPEAELAAADPVYRRWIRTRLASGRAHALIAETDGVPRGSAVCWLREDQPRPGSPRLRLPYILSVYVAPEHRGRGIAGRLTRGLVDWAMGQGYPRTTLHASRFGRSVYRRLGFARTWEMRFGGSHRKGPEARVPRDALPSPRAAADRRRRRRR